MMMMIMMLVVVMVLVMLFSKAGDGDVYTATKSMVMTGEDYTKPS